MRDTNPARWTSTTSICWLTSNYRTCRDPRGWTTCVIPPRVDHVGGVDDLGLPVSRPLVAGGGPSGGQRRARGRGRRPPAGRARRGRGPRRPLRGGQRGGSGGGQDRAARGA